MGKVKRKLKTEFVKTLSVYDMEGSIQDLIERLNNISKEFPEHSNFSIDAEYYDDSVDFYIYAARLETQLEADKRAKEAKEAKIAAQARKLKKEKEERAELARLQAKYGNP